MSCTQTTHQRVGSNKGTGTGAGAKGKEDSTGISGGTKPLHPLPTYCAAFLPRADG
ncbi:MAG: hypothetical protein JJT87_11740 [Halomonas sp.]|nr:hypothetical protein [Halomonas sp.]MCC5902583.1 hypothetical protein [Halomonas sp.]